MFIFGALLSNSPQKKWQKPQPKKRNQSIFFHCVNVNGYNIKTHLINCKRFRIKKNEKKI